jgi:hypothetical protein
MIPPDAANNKTMATTSMSFLLFVSFVLFALRVSMILSMFVILLPSLIRPDPHT